MGTLYSGNTDLRLRRLHQGSLVFWLPLATAAVGLGVEGLEFELAVAAVARGPGKNGRLIRRNGLVRLGRGSALRAVLALTPTAAGRLLLLLRRAVARRGRFRGGVGAA